MRPDHLLHRPVQEDRSRRRNPAAGRARLRPEHAVVRPGLDRRARLHLAALFRFLRLFRHGDRPVADVRHLPAAQFQFAVQGRQHHRFLAALAHDAVALPARLSLYSARRQPARRDAALCQPDDHDGARRPVARRGLDLCRLGRAARRLSLHQSCLGQLWTRGRAAFQADCMSPPLS